MHRFCSVLVFLFLVISVSGQVTTNPVLPVADDSIEITLDITGTALDGYSGVIYAHTGVTVNGVQWQNIIGDWGDNTVQPAMTSIGNNLYTLNITPDVFDYYNVATTDEVTELSFVFRSADTNLQTSPDIFIALFESGVTTVVITSPDNNDVFSVSETIEIEANATQSVDFELSVNGSVIGTSTMSTILSELYTFTEAGDYTISVIGAVNGTEVSSDEIYVYVPSITENSTQPPNLKNGLNFNQDNTITFLLTAPGKTDVMLIGDFNEWRFRENFQMKKDGDDFWLTLDSSMIDLSSHAEYAYQYVADFEIYIADPFAEKILDPANDSGIDPANYPNLKPYPQNAFGLVSVFEMNATPYEWQHSLTKPDATNLVIYELLVRDFSEEDGFQQVIDRLDYLEGLGVNAIEFMPLSEFEGNDSWGYNVSFHHALDKMYGTKNKLKELVDACHERGIAVILDVVFNHAFSQSSLCQLWWDPVNFRPTAENPYLNVEATHDFNVGYDFNHESEFTKEYVKQTLVYWVEEFRFDGFRFDLSKGFTQNNTLGDIGAWNMYDSSRVSILQDYANSTWNATGDYDIYMILEHLSENDEEKALADFGFMVWGKMTDEFNQNTMGYLDNIDVSRAYHANRGWNEPRLVTYMESHDEERLMYKNLSFGNSDGSYDVTELSTALDRNEAATVLFYSIPGPKMLWQFGELGYDISIDENGRTGRKPVPWTLGYDSEVDRSDLYGLTATMITLKNAEPVFNSLDNDFDLDTPQKRINLYDFEKDVVVLVNFGLTAANIDPNFSETGNWFEFFSGDEIQVSNTSTPINLGPGEYRIYSNEFLENPLSIVEVVSQNMTIYPNPARDSFAVSNNVDGLELYDIAGRIVLKIDQPFPANQSIDITKLKVGVYILKTTIGHQTTSQRLIKRTRF